MVESGIINILIAELTKELAQQIYSEYESRMREAKYLISNYKPYSILKNEIKTIEVILSISIFYRRIIANLDSANKFFSYVNRNSNAERIEIGSYSINKNEINKIYNVVLDYQKIIDKYKIPLKCIEYKDTKELLNTLVHLKYNDSETDSN